MTLDRAIRRQLCQTIYVAHKTAESQAAVPTYGTPSAVRARVNQKTGTAFTADGDEVTTSHELISATEIVLTDRIWLPGLSSSDSTKAILPKQINPGYDVNGVITHWQVLL